MSKTIFKITDGKFGMALVGASDPATWQAPAGAVLPDVALADYDAATAAFACQVVTGVLNATENVTQEQLDGTWCDLPETQTIVGEDTFAVALDVYQDPTLAEGLTSWCYEHRGKRAYLYFGAGGDQVPPVAIGVVTVKSMGIGGGRSAARSQVTFPFDRAPDIQFGTVDAWRVVFGDKDTAPVDGPTIPLTADDADDDAEAVEAVG